MADLQALYPAVVAAAAAVPLVGRGRHAGAVLAKNYAELANLLMLAKRHRLAMSDGVALMSCFIAAPASSWGQCSSLLGGGQAASVKAAGLT